MPRLLWIKCTSYLLCLYYISVFYFYFSILIMHWKSMWVNHTKTCPGPFHPKIKYMHKENEAYFGDHLRSFNWGIIFMTIMNFFLQIDIIIALIIIIHPDFFLFTNGWPFTSYKYYMFPEFIVSTVAILCFCHGIKKRIIFYFFFFLKCVYISQFRLLRTVGLYLAILAFMSLYWELWEKSQNCEI